MTGQETYFLEAAIDGNKLSLCFYERSTSLRLKIDIEIKLDKINELSSEIIGLIHRSHLSSPSSSQIYEDLKRYCVCLFDELLPDQVRSKIKSIPGGNIVLLIDEPLVFIPWELLHDGNDYLSLKFSIGRIVRTSRQVREAVYRSVGVPPKMLVLADPCGDLQGAQQEAKVIRSELDKNGQVAVTTKTANITLDYVKKHIRDYDVLHYAGHADHGTSHDISGLRLSDGCFSANDIIKLGVTAPLPALIFCNACQSAHDNADDMSRGVFGIANAFLTSGVRHYVGCLWKIPDRESVTAAEVFYRSLFSGISVGQALRLTRLELIKEYGWSSLVWASYILYGDSSIVFGAVPEVNRVLPAKKTRSKKVFAVIAFGLFLVGAVFIAVRQLNRPPEPPAILIEDFLVQSTQKKDVSLTFEVLSELKKISSANLVAAERATGLIRGKVKRAVHTEIERTDGMLHLTVKVLDPSLNKIIELKEFVVKDGSNRGREIADRILDLTKAGLSKTEETELTRRPDVNPEAHRLLSKSWDLFNKGDFNEALELCQKIKKIDPGNPDLYKRMGNIYDRLGKKNEALNAYTQYAELCKKANNLKSLSNAYINMGWIIQTMGDDVLAYNYLERALQIAELDGYSYETAKALSQLGVWHSGKKDFKRAKELLEQAIDINRNNLPDYNHRYSLGGNYIALGEVYEKEGNYSDSLKYLNMGLDVYKELGAEKVIAEVKARIERVFDKQRVAEKF